MTEDQEVPVLGSSPGQWGWKELMVLQHAWDRARLPLSLSLGCWRSRRVGRWEGTGLRPWCESLGCSTQRFCSDHLCLWTSQAGNIIHGALSEVSGHFT